MEHLVILLIHFVLWLDRLTLRSLQRVIPHLPELMASPTRILAEENITIGPTKRWPSSLALGGTIGFFIWLGTTFLFLWLNGHPQGAKLNPLEKWVVFLLFLASLTVTTWIVLRWRRGGSLVLTAAGVEFHQRGSVVHCPWALFDTAGQPFFTSRERMLLPVNPRAVPLVKVMRGETLLSEGMRVRAKAIRFQSVNLAVLRAFYEVVPTEVGDLLLTLGRKIRAPVPPLETTHLASDEPVHEEIAPLRRHTNGVMTANLTRLSLPPFCCACQQGTQERKQFHVHQVNFRLLGLRLLELGQMVTLLVPICADCQRGGRRSRWRGAVLGIFTSFAIAFTLCILAALAKDLRPVPGILVVLALINLVLTPALGYKLGDAWSRPVLVERYRPQQATVDVWFRSRRYSDAVFELHQGEEVRTTPGGLRGGLSSTAFTPELGPDGWSEEMRLGND